MDLLLDATKGNAASIADIYRRREFSKPFANGFVHHLMNSCSALAFYLHNEPASQVIAQIVVKYLAIRSQHILNSFMPSKRQTRCVCTIAKIL